MRSTTWTIGAALVLALSAAQSAQASSATVVVPGTSDPFLSGAANGTSCCGDTAPAESPVLAGAVTGGTTITFTNTSGGVNYVPSPPTDPPAGDLRFLVSDGSAENIAGYYNAPVDALVGVFLGSKSPVPIAGLMGLNFASSTSPFVASTASLTPGLQQIFYIGNGTLNTGTTQDYKAPVGATELYLGTVDGSGWYNNSGEIAVTVNGLTPSTTVTSAPEPVTWALLLFGFIGVAFSTRSRRIRLAVPG